MNFNKSRVLWLLNFLVIAARGQTTSNTIDVGWGDSEDEYAVLGTIDLTTEMTDLVLDQNLQNFENETEPVCNELPTEEQYLECLKAFAFKIDTMEWVLIFCHSVVFVTGLVSIIHLLI